jgi:mxaJ protein
MTPRIHRVIAPVALLAAAPAALAGGLVLLAACRRESAQRPALVEGSQPRSAVLRVCADPNNLPFSNARGEGFENHLASMLAADRGERLEYDWHAQRRGFVRETLGSGRCDVIMGVPASYERVLPTRPYYRSTYVFVSRADRRLRLSSLDDPRLHRLRVGVQLAGDDYANTPPAHALSRRGVVANVVGFTLYGDYKEDSPPARIVDAVARREIDTAIVWGPLAGFFARREPAKLVLAPVTPQVDLPFLPFAWDISMGVRRGNSKLRDQLDDFIERRGPEIDRLLDEYGVPRAPRGGTL